MKRAESLQVGCAIHNPSLYYLATLAAREKRTEPTQENITLCYESSAAMRSVQGFHVVRRAPGVLPLAGRHRARAVLRANDSAPTGTRAGFRHGLKMPGCFVREGSTPLATCRNGNGGHEGNGARNSNASARSASTPKMPIFRALRSIWNSLFAFAAILSADNSRNDQRDGSTHTVAP
jgi:hypothetical protein